MNEIDWQFPYPSQKMPVLARNMVASSQPLAAQAGLRMLLKGGNAVDAALATAIALTVVEPVMNGIGGDAFALVWDGEKLHGLNASGRAPAAWNPQRFAGLNSMPSIGWDTVTVPGGVSGWKALSDRFGKLPFADLFKPAASYARDGFPVSPTIARQWQAQVPVLKDQPGFAEAFMPDGRAPLPGELFSCPQQADTLERIAATEGEAFYRGELAERIAAFSRKCGAALTAEDLASHQPEWVEPISHAYQDYSLHEIPPSGQGIAALMALGILGHHEVRKYPVDSAESMHVQIEAMKLAFYDVYRYVGEPAAMRVSVKELLDPDYLAQRATLIDMEQARLPGHGVPGNSGTVYLAAADASGMMVSYIQSNFKGFGSGVVVPGTGISLHNRGIGFSLEPGHPNQVGGGKRPFHTIIPGFMMRRGQPLMSFGVMGGSMQAQGHVQMMVRLADYHQNPQTASDAPRWRVNEGLHVSVEHEMSADAVQGLRKRGHIVTQAARGDLEFGSAQLIRKLGHGYAAGSDHRRDGQAVGF
jgi:gamma-glutamyltranspeptidase/glutathione hydrolase